MSRKTIYLDHASATPIDKKVSALISTYEKKFFANPSALHRGGVEARSVIEDARSKIARRISAHFDEIIFTGSGTESDALAILGTIANYELLMTNGDSGKTVPHIVTTNIEHPAVLETCKLLEKQGRAKVTYVAVDANGIINPKDIREALKENTVLVSVMYANNEIGTIQPIQEIAKAIRHFRKIASAQEESGGLRISSAAQKSVGQTRQILLALPLFHTDACQAMNYLDVENIEKLGVDLLSFNSSKIYGPKGVGVLFKKRGVLLAPLYVGGGQESGLRSGTENTASIAGFALALEQTSKMREKESARLVVLRDYSIEKLLALSGNFGYKIILNGDKEKRLPNNINISISGIASELLVIELDARGIAVSAKSACKSDEPDESYVINALRKAQASHQALPGATDGSLRISLGRQTSKSDMDALVKALKQILEKYKKWK